MAWFDPPLHKPGNKKCPSCGNPVWWASMWWGFNGSSAFLCSRCGAELKVAVIRSILGWFLCVAYYPLWFWILTLGWGWAISFLIYGGILFFILVQWWFTSVRLSERVPPEQVEWRHPPWYKPGNKRCPNCGGPARQRNQSAHSGKRGTAPGAGLG
jgi:ribosomal protein S27AE